MNLQETIRKVLMEQNIPSTPNELIKSLPEGLKKLFFNQWKAKQNPKWHPEGNTLKHIIVVLKRAYEHYPDDPNMIMAALFHDLGKMDTYKINPKTGQPTAYGHEDVSTKYVEEFKDWIESFNGTDVEEIKYLVKNHMKVKPSTWDTMKDTKKEPIQKHPAFDKLMGFTDKLDGGGTEIRKTIKEAIKEVVNENELPVSVRRRLRTDDDHITYLLKNSVMNKVFDTKNKSSDLIVAKACRDTAYGLLDTVPELYDAEGEKFRELITSLRNFLFKKYGEELKKFTEEFLEEQEENGDRYVFWKHSERNGGNGFSESTDSWMKFLARFGSWFPRFNWKELKQKLDNTGYDVPILISKPGDQDNTMNYYFSVYKVKR